jgi:hypothetical protein
VGSSRQRCTNVLVDPSLHVGGPSFVVGKTAGSEGILWMKVDVSCIMRC